VSGRGRVADESHTDSLDPATPINFLQTTSSAVLPNGHCGVRASAAIMYDRARAFSPCFSSSWRVSFPPPQAQQPVASHRPEHLPSVTYRRGLRRPEATRDDAGQSLPPARPPVSFAVADVNN